MSTLPAADGPPDPAARDGVLRELVALVPTGAPDPQDPELLDTLWDRTLALRAAVGRAAGEDPFADVYERDVPLAPDAAGLVADRTVLVTGGEGSVGDALIARLTELGVRRIVSVDHARSAAGAHERTLRGRTPFVRYGVDVRDRSGLERVFERERPEVVFHLAAQRLPGVAEVLVRETLTTNLGGTRNVASLCERFGVERCVFASTGKSSQYFSADVYAGSKKVAEWWLASCAERSRATGFAAARFTHIVQNSPVTSEIDEKIRSGLLRLHEPGRFIYVQSIREAVALLLNALPLATPGRFCFTAVEDPGWPIDVLRIALYELERSGRRAPICFGGLPRGYVRQTFQGQFAWDGPAAMNSMVNALEAASAELRGGMVVASPVSVPADAVERALTEIDAAVGGPLTELEVADVFAGAARSIAFESLRHSDPGALAEILVRGCDPALVPDDDALAEHGVLVTMLLAALDERTVHGGARFEQAYARAREVTGEADADTGSLRSGRDDVEVRV